MLFGDADDEEEEENERVTMMRMKLHACERREREKIDQRPFLILFSFFFQARKTPQSSSSSRRGLRSSLLARQDRTDKEDTYIHTDTFEQNHLHFATLFLSLLLPWLWLLGSSSLLFVLA